MGEFKFESKGTRTFLVYCLDENEKIDSLAMGMFENNKIKNIITPDYYQLDSDRYLKYDVTSKINLQMYLQSPSSKKHFLTFLSGLVGAFVSAEQFYTLVPEAFCTELQYIYITVHNSEADLVYLPIEGYERKFDLMSFIREITSRKAIEPKEDAIYTGIFNILNDTSITKFSELKRRIDGLNTPVSNETRTMHKEGSVSRKAMNEGIKIVKQGADPALNEAAKNEVIAKRNDAEKNVNRPSFVPPSAAPDNHQKSGEKSEKKEGLFGSLFKNKKKESPASNNADKGSKVPFNIPGQKSPVASKVSTEGGHSLSGFNNGNNVSDRSEAPKNVNQAAFNVNRSDFHPRNNSSPIDVGMSKNSPDPISKVDNNNVDFDVHTVVLEDDGYESTIVIDDVAEFKDNPRLLRKVTKETIKITKSFFKIGKSATNVDYTVTNNPYVGNFHAYILQENGKYYVVDNNSKNHTFVNDGMPIPPNEKIEIYHGSIIKFANEQFEFLIK